MKELLRWIAVIVIALAAALLIRTYIFNIAAVPTGSMEPTILAGDRVFVYKLFSDLQRGDTVVFNPPKAVAQSLPEEMRAMPLLKRIVALPGERVEIVCGDVYINGELLSEPYVPTKGEDNMAELVLGDNEYFVLGDNREQSYDARYWPQKFINASDVVGKAIFRFGAIK